MARNDPKQAIKLLKLCLVKDKKHCPCFRGLGLAYGHARIENHWAAIGYLQRYLDECPTAPDAEKYHRLLATQPPRTPKDLDACNPEDSVVPTNGLPRRVGETIRYHVDINGFSVGVVDVKIERHGAFEKQTVTEYRAAFNIDSIVSTFVPVKGRAAALVPAQQYYPVRAMNRYEAHDKKISEELLFENRAVG